MDEKTYYKKSKRDYYLVEIRANACSVQFRKTDWSMAAKAAQWLKTTYKEVKWLGHCQLVDEMSHFNYITTLRQLVILLMRMSTGATSIRLSRRCTTTKTYLMFHSRTWSIFACYCYSLKFAHRLNLDALIAYYGKTQTRVLKCQIWHGIMKWLTSVQ